MPSGEPARRVLIPDVTSRITSTVVVDPRVRHGPSAPRVHSLGEMSEFPWVRARLLPALLTVVLTACAAGGAPTAKQSDRISTATTAASTEEEPGAVPAPSDPPVATTTTPSTAPPPTEGEDGADGVDDPYFAGLGNGGYDVAHYDLSLDVDAVQNHLAGTATITARAIVDLASFSLDLHWLEVSAVSVDDEPADSTATMTNYRHACGDDRRRHRVHRRGELCR